MCGIGRPVHRSLVERIGMRCSSDERTRRTFSNGSRGRDRCVCDWIIYSVNLQSKVSRRARTGRCSIRQTSTLHRTTSVCPMPPNARCIERCRHRRRPAMDCRDPSAHDVWTQGKVLLTSNVDRAVSHISNRPALQRCLDPLWKIRHPWKLCLSGGRHRSFLS